MDLRAIATHFNWEAFDYLDPTTRLWVSCITGRFAPADRFLSNFNRPTRKRMLFTEFDSDLTQVDVIKHTLTGDQYIVGVSRKDAFLAGKITQLLICHMVTPNGKTAGIGQFIRPTVSGTGDDLGWVTLEDIGEAFLDLELRSTSTEPGSKEAQIGSYYCWTEKNKALLDNDGFTLHGTDYVVEEVAYDSELLYLRVVSRSHHFSDFVISYDTGVRQRDPLTGLYSQGVVDRNVSGYIVATHNGNDGFATDSGDYIEIRIDKAHIGFKPMPDQSLTYEGKTYVISYVEDAEHRNQWHIKAK